MGIFANPTKIRPFNHTTHSTRHNSCNFLEAPKHTLEVRPKSIHSNSLCPLRIKTPWHTHLKKTRLLERNEKEKDDKSQYFLTRGDRANTHTGIYMHTLEDSFESCPKETLRRREGEKERRCYNDKILPLQETWQSRWLGSLSLSVSLAASTQSSPAQRIVCTLQGLPVAATAATWLRVCMRAVCMCISALIHGYIGEARVVRPFLWGRREREREKESEGRNASARQSSNKLYRRGIILALSEGIQR